MKARESPVISRLLRWHVVGVWLTLDHTYAFSVPHHGVTTTRTSRPCPTMCIPLSMSSSSSSSSSTNIETQPPALDLSPQELQGLLQTAEAAARSAGQIILDAQATWASSVDRETNSAAASTTDNNNEHQIKTSIKDIVTQYDKQAQEAVRNIVQQAYPDHAFLGEEDVAPGAAASAQALRDVLQRTQDKSTSPFCWICDPIDGTANFVAGLPLCGVTLAVIYRGQAVMGTIYDPHAQEVFAAVRGQGATVNGRPLTVDHRVAQMSDAIVNAGCPADPQAFAASLRGVTALNTQTRGVRMVACSALTTAWIAAGRLTAHFGYDLSSWDLVAGALLIQEAGGTVTDLDGSRYTLETRHMLCSNGLVHDSMLQALTEANAVSFERASD